MKNKNQDELIEEFNKTFPFLVTLEDVMRFLLALRLDCDVWKEQAKHWHDIADRCEEGCACLAKAVRGE